MKRKACERGVEVPMPRARRIIVADEGIVAESSDMHVIPLQASVCPKLAAKFPRFAKGV